VKFDRIVYFNEMPWWLKTSTLLPAASSSNECGREASRGTVRSSEYGAVSGCGRGYRRPKTEG